MNMLRVWGGGIYEDDYFYELCDKYGLLLWHDFMFSCSMYPGDDEFIDNVTQEVIDNVKRLRNHAAIALWCGNNQIDVAWCQGDMNCGWGWKQQYTPAQREAIWHSYDTLFHSIYPTWLKPTMKPVHTGLHRLQPIGAFTPPTQVQWAICITGEYGMATSHSVHFIPPSAAS
jgi:hypothetical protein